MQWELGFVEITTSILVGWRSLEMSAKFMHVFTDENPELQKQIGCMTGIFQMFDRHHLIAGRRLGGHNHKRLPSGRGNVGAERNGSSPQIVMEKYPSKSLHENQRISMESSRTSFSSSTCSSFSSLECNKSTQQERPSFDRAICPERPLKTPPKLRIPENETRPVSCKPRSNLLNAPAQPGRHSLEFRDVVKDSINKDTRRLLIKTSTKEEVKHHVLKHRDSPRPTQLSKSMDGPYIIGSNGKSRTSVDLNESLQVLARLKEGPWHFSEAGEPLRSSDEAKDARFNPVSREAPRFSYDGREISRTSLDSREHSKPTTKLRELPRLSLDSREGSLKSTNFDPKPNLILKDLDKRNMNQVSTAINLQKEMGSHKHSPSVVAKLMGLEAMPNLCLAAQEPMDLMKTYIRKDCDPFNAQLHSNFISKSLNTTQDSRQDRLSRSPNNSLKDPVNPRPNKPDAVMKPVSNSRIPIETAPWSHPDRIRAAPKATSGNREPRLKQSSETVYSEIEKRLKELEFRQSNKDLRALKQILDAMQAKGMLEIKGGEAQRSEVSARKNNCNQTLTGDDPNLKLANVRSRLVTHPVPTLMKGSNTPRAFESPIVIMKPAKSFNKSSLSASSVIPLEGLSGLQKLRIGDPMDKKKASINNRVAKDQTPKASPTEISNQPLLSIDKKFINRSEDNSTQKTRSRSVQSSSRPQQSTRENSGTSVKTSSSLSPRLQQRKFEVERKLRPPLPYSESNKPPRQSISRQPSESVSPRGKVRRKPTQVQENDGQLSESSETRNASQQGDDVSLRSDSNMSLASQVDVEVTSADWSANMSIALYQQGSTNTSERADKNTASVLKQKKSSLNLNENASSMELAAVAPEQPSPISVLDPSFYRDDLPHSPMKTRSDSFKDDDGARPSGDCWNLMADLPWKLSSKINHKKLENIENLVQKLRDLSSADVGPQNTDHIASLCETQNPDHRYVSEILLASGILMKDLSGGPMGPTPIQLHPSGHPINPDLFLVLEQTKSGWLAKPETIHESALRPKPDPEKLHRKLVFDVVNEILIRKLELTSQGPPISLLLRSRKLTGRFPSGQRLLREMCSEIEQLEAESSRSDDSVDDGNLIPGEELLQRMEGWTDFGREVPGVVLEIERSIFKDLIDEVVNGEASSFLQHRPSRRRRQLFANK